MKHTDEEIKDINLTFNGRGIKRLNIPPVIFTMNDINKVQMWAGNRYTNFNGGFGIMPGSDYILKYKVDNKNEFTFISDKPLRSDVAAYSDRPEMIRGFNQMSCTESLNWLEMLIIICLNDGIEFRYDRSIIDEILNIE
jgi:hypothetical protein